jgi:hypothetical protein
MCGKLSDVTLYEADPSGDPVEFGQNFAKGMEYLLRRAWASYMPSLPCPGTRQGKNPLDRLPKVRSFKRA